MPASPPTDTPLSRKPGRHSLWGPVLFWILLAVVFFGIPGYYLEERERGIREWKKYEAEAKQRGIKLQFADYIPPQIPDAENFASIPIFEAIFRASDSGQRIPETFKLPAPLQGERPKLSDPTKQTRIDLAAWQKYFAEAELVARLGEPSSNREWQKYFAEAKLHPSDAGHAAADVLQDLERFAAPLAELHEAGKRPHCRFPVHWEEPFAKAPQFGVIMIASELYALRIAAHLETDGSAAAYEDWQDGLRLVTVLHAEPALLAGTVRMNIARKMEGALWSGLAAHRWAEPELRKIEADLAALDWLQDYAFTLNSSRGSENRVIDLYVKDPRVFGAMLHPMSLLSESSFSDNLGFLYPSGWLYRSKVRTDRYFDELLGRIEIGERRWHSERPLPSAPENITATIESIQYLTFMWTARTWKVFENLYLQAAAMTDEARMACALERFRMARGNYPGALVELSPEFLPDAPVQVVNGQPYRYRLEEDGNFVLYSVGTDLHDDGGVIDPQLTFSRQRDWVWRYPPK